MKAKDYWICPYCGLEYDRRNEWEMYQVDAHIDRHDRGELDK